MAAGIALTLFFHGAIVFSLVVGALWGEEEEVEEQEVVFDDVELLALGEDVDPDMMPRLTGDEGAPPEAEVAEEETPPPPEVEPEPEPEDVDPEPEDVEPEAEEPEVDEEEERRRRREERQRQMDEALGQFDAEGRGDEAPEGSEEGTARGTSTDGDAIGTYQDRLLEVLGEHWEVPVTISDEEVQRLAGRVSVYVRLSDDGHVTQFQFRQKSGNEQFDTSIERLMRHFEADEGGEVLPLPDDDGLRRQVVEGGLTLSTWENLDRQ